MSNFEKIMPKLLSASSSFLKHIFVVFAYIFANYFFFFFSKNYAHNPEEIYFWKTSILIAAYASTAFAFAIYNKNQCLRFLDKDSRDIFSELFSFDFFIDLAFGAIFFLIFSVEIFSPVAVIAAIISNIGTYIFARRIWLTKRENDEPTHLFTAKLIFHLILSLPGLFLLFFFMSSLIPSIPTLLMVARLLSYLLIFPLILAVFLYVRAFIKMAKFLKRLKHFCKTNNIKAPALKHPYFSVFKTHPDNTFEMEINGKIYACNLVSFANIFKPVIFKADGYFYRISAKKLKQKIKPTLFFETRYGYESSRPKLVLITSEPYVIKIQEGNQSKVFDTGDICGEYKIFTPNGFFGAAERNTLDRKTYN